MTSEIRANTLKNRVGLGTVSFTNTGPVVSGIVTANTIRLADDNKIQLGNDQDLEIVHDPSNGIIRSISSGGNMHVESRNHVEINVGYNPSNGSKHNAIKANANSSVSLYHANSTKFATTSTGAQVYGTLVATGADINGDLDVDGHTNLDNVSIAGVTTTSGNIVIENAEPSLFLTDTNGNPDYKIFNDQGAFKIYDTTYSATRLQIGPSNGEMTVLSNTNFPNGITMNPGTASVVNTIAQRLGNTTTKIRFPANNTFTVETNGVERLNVNSDGQFTFNHTTVGTSYNFLGPSADNNWGGFIKLNSSNNSTVVANIHASTSGMWFAYGGDYEYRLFIKSNGSVGIGTNNPGGLLTVYGSTAELRLQHAGNSSYSRIISDASNQLNFYTGGGPHLAMAVGDDRTVTFKGNVLINNTSGVSLLQLNDNTNNALHELGTPGNGDFRITVDKNDVASSQEFQLYMRGNDTTDLAFHIDHDRHVKIPNGNVIVDNSLVVGTTSGNANNKIHARLADGSIASNSSASVILAENSGNTWITIGSGASNYGGILFADSGSADIGQIRYNHSTNGLEFLTNGGNSSNIRLCIDSNGRLSLGFQASPGSYPTATVARQVQAEFKGSIDTGNNKHDGSLALNCTNNNANLHIIRSQNNQTSGISLGNVNFTGFDGTDYHVAAQITGARDAAGGNNDMPGRLVFLTTANDASSPTERLRIDSNGKFCFGTYTNGYQNNDSVATFVNAASSGVENPLITLWNPTTVNDARAGIDFLTNAGSGTGRDGAFIRASNNGVNGKAHLVFGELKDETYTETFRITSDAYVHLGNSGHGTNKVGGQAVTGEDFDPYFKLYASTSNHWLMHLRSDTATGSNGIFMRAGNNSNNYSMYITARDEHTPHFVVRGDGNIGINRTNPDQRLCINGNVETNAYSDTNGSGGYYTAKGLIIGNAYDAGKASSVTDDRNAIIWQERGLDLSFATNDAERFRLDYRGAVIFKDKDSGKRGGGFYSRTKTVTLTGDNTSSFMRFELDHGALAGMIFLTGSNGGASVAKTYAFAAQYGGNGVTTNLLADTGQYSGKNFSFTSSTNNNQHTFMVQVSGGTQEVNMTVHLGNCNQNLTYTEL